MPVSMDLVGIEPSAERSLSGDIVSVGLIAEAGMNSTDTKPSGLRHHLAGLARLSASGLVTTEEAARAWGVARSVATGRLDRLVRAGWLSRVLRGLFYVLPLEAGAHTTVDDPWVLATRAFAPAYIGGWSAAEHWGLTEQLFRSTFVVTAGSVRTTTATLLGAEFRLVRVPVERVASVPSAWRGPVRVAVSDRERTLADALAQPEWVGGVRHLAQLLVTYRQSAHWNTARLLAALALHPRGAAYKRLGYLAETVLGGDAALVEAARAHLTKGVIRLDPSVKAPGRIVSRWGLRVNATVGGDEA